MKERGASAPRSLTIVGHGGSAKGYVPQGKVLRFRDNIPKDGPTDIICSLYEWHKRSGKEFWHLGEWRKYCVEQLQPFNPSNPKPSSGLSAVMIAHAKGYEEIGLIGFDFTLHPERLTKRKRWTHDLDAEYRCIQTYNVIDYE